MITLLLYLSVIKALMINCIKQPTYLVKELHIPESHSQINDRKSGKTKQTKNVRKSGNIRVENSRDRTQFLLLLVLLLSSAPSCAANWPV